MSDTNSIFARLESYVQADRENSIRLAYLEPIFVAVAGILLEQTIVNFSFGLLMAFLFFATVYGLLFYMRLQRERSFPGAIVEELRVRAELEQKTNIIERRSLLDGFIEDAIQLLNTNTCTITTDPDARDRLCESGLAAGLGSVIAPLRDFPHYLLDCSSNRFTVGGVVEDYCYIPSDGYIEDHLPEPPCKTSILVFRDDFGFGEKISEQGGAAILSSPDISGPVFYIREVILRARNEKRFSYSELPDQGMTYTMVAAPIPAVCEDPNERGCGVLFLISKRIDSIPEDLGDILGIFGRIVANWISKYDDCVWDKFWAMQGSQEDITEPGQSND